MIFRTQHRANYDHNSPDSKEKDSKGIKLFTSQKWHSSPSVVAYSLHTMLSDNIPFISYTTLLTPDPTPSKLQSRDS